VSTFRVSVQFYDDKDNQRNLSNVFNNYWVNLKYYKIVKKLKENNIDFIQFNNWYGWADLLKVFDDGKYSKFATFRFRNQVDYLEVTLPKAKDNEIKQYIVNNDVDIEDVVNALLNAYKKETFGDNVTFKKITDTIEEMVNSYCYQNILQHVDEKGTLLCIEGCPLNATLQDGKIREARVFLKHKDGYRIPVMVKTLPIYDIDKRLSRRLKFLLMNASKNKFITKILN